jgi:hypothetical protein
MDGTAYQLVTTVASASSQVQVVISPQTVGLGVRLVDLSDNFRLFRFTRLECGFCQTDPANVAVNDGVIVGFHQAAVTAPTTAQQVSELSKVAMSMHRQTTKEWLRLSRRDLAGIAPWYATEASATDPLLDTQGGVFISAIDGTTGLAVADVVGLHWKWEIQFKGALSPAVSLERKFRRMLRNPDRMQEMFKQNPELYSVLTQRLLGVQRLLQVPSRCELEEVKEEKTPVSSSSWSLLGYK